MTRRPGRSFLPDPPRPPLPAGLAFLRHARFRLRDDYPVKIRAALESLSDEDIWWRPNPESNSAGNLVLHLAGNIRQWILAGLEGAPDRRDRPAEFAASGGRAKTELLALLSAAVEDADAALARLESELAAAGSDAPLQRERQPQGFPQSTLDAVFHVVEHFSYHTGQIVYLAKLRAGKGLALYDEQQLNSQ